MPVAISIEPTTACNLGCPECPSGLKVFSRPTGNLRLDLNKRILDELAPWLWYVNFYFQGEPYIHPQFLDLVHYAKSKGIYTSTSTNAHFLSDEKAKSTVESGLDRLIISIDGTSQDTYEQYRVNGSLDKVIEGTKNIIRWKKELRSSTPHIIFQFLVVRPNEHQVDEVFQLAKELGVNEVRLKTAQVYNFENGNPLIPENEKYSRYKKKKDGSWSVKNKMEDHCWRMWSSSVITWDGKLVPCCFDKDAEYRLGDLKQESFRSNWTSPAYNQFRNAVLSGRDQIDICKNCSEGTKVWA
ncbi:MAG TPA: radical SAM protein [Flavobacteriales bacterium]|nr:radical SAM protein [Flavobacteriales bacterium]HRE95529.1 radical SAM/SPASM domain-containing protein [Flavobacteriales bacterium]